MSEKKVLVIGLDGATFDLILPWAREGRLPNIKKLVDWGTYGNISSISPIISPVIWTSFATGKNPGKHGVFDFLKCSPNSYDFVPVTSRDVKSETIWDIASKAGKKVVVINVPMTYPPKEVNGTMITDFLSPETAIFTYPEGLTKELKNKGYVIEAMNKSFTPGDEDELLKRLHYTTEKRTEIGLELMNEDWDFFMVVFTGTDRIQHYFWKYMEGGHAKYGDAILKFYQKLDEKIGQMLDRIDGNTSVVIMSDHGFGPLEGEAYVNWWLTENGMLKYKSPLTYWTIKLGLTQQNIASFLKKIHIFNFIKNLLERVGLWKSGKAVPYPSYSAVDFSTTQAYAGNFGGQIYLNLRQREPSGVIEAGEYELVRNKIVDGLKKLEDPKTGNKFFKNVYKREELYKGPYIEEAPDLIVETGAYDAVGWFGYNRVCDYNPIKSGAHQKNGILIMWGAGIKKSKVENAEMVDLAPTILDLMGIPIPEDMDGKSLV